MYQPVELFIGLRYIHSGSRFFRFVYWISISGIMMGIIALVTILSLMNGFEHKLQKNILGLIPQAILSSTTGSINPHHLPKNEIKLQGVNCIVPLTTGDVVLQSASDISIGVMLGIDPTQYDPIAPYLVNVKQTDLKPGKYNAILGKKLAEKLGVNRGDQIRVIVPFSNQLTPIGRLPNQRLFRIIGIFTADNEVDSYQLLFNIQDASHLMRYPRGNITGWRLYLNEPLKVDKLIRQKLPKGIKWQDWRDRKGELFQAARMEKNMIGLLLSLIVIVATFNIITSLALMVMEKQREIAILQTQGLKSWRIMITFVVQGISAGIIGVLLGVGVGILFTSQLNNVLSINGTFLKGIIFPVVIEPLQVLNISLITIVAALLSALYPSWLAAAIQPAEALRYE